MTLNDILEQGTTIQAGRGIRVVSMNDEYETVVLYESKREFTEFLWEVDETWANKTIKYIYPWGNEGLCFEVEQ